MTDDTDTRAIAIVGESLAVAVLARLEARGLLTPADVDQVVEGTLESLEQDFPDGLDVRAARQMLETIGRSLANVRRARTAQP